ncbi:ECF transporter S component [Clostridium hydrogeniformans]|uniref:ECF transporter S component n=1 Tax=Clostridium hydrogeniformans TaxID=349933 RepID=UPI00047FAB89|nr:ECF transporter S component [Clostridium hydrogeniformans]
MKRESGKGLKNLNTLIKISLLGSMAFLLMLFDFPLPIFPSFLKIDLSDLPALVGSFALGPIAGVVIELLKNILHAAIKGSSTAMVGEIANFFVGSVLVFTSGYIYNMKKTRKSAVTGLVVGTIVMSVLAGILNYVIMIPFYAKAFGMPMEAIIGMGTKLNSNIKDLTSLVLWAIIPFNLLKGFAVSFITAAIYKKISIVLQGEVSFPRSAVTKK